MSIAFRQITLVHVPQNTVADSRFSGTLPVFLGTKQNALTLTTPVVLPPILRDTVFDKLKRNGKRHEVRSEWPYLPGFVTSGLLFFLLVHSNGFINRFTASFSSCWSSLAYLSSITSSVKSSANFQSSSSSISTPRNPLHCVSSHSCFKRTSTSKGLMVKTKATMSVTLFKTHPIEKSPFGYTWFHGRQSSLPLSWVLFFYVFYPSLFRSSSYYYSVRLRGTHWRLWCAHSPPIQPESETTTSVFSFYSLTSQYLYEPVKVVLVNNSDQSLQLLTK